MSSYRNILSKRALEQRSFLRFDFFEGGAKRPPVSFILPFFENPDIQENKRANYEVYDVLSRSSNLYAYTGAKSRKFKIKFNITLPHILDSEVSLTPNDFIEQPILDSRTDDLSRFMELGGSVDENNRPNVSLVENPEFNTRFKTLSMPRIGRVTELRRKFDQLVSESSSPSLLNPLRTIIEALFGNTRVGYEQQRAVIDKALEVCLWWVNLVRCSVVNNHQNPTQGPPTVRLNHGILYRDIPCICMGYELTWDDAAGYDLRTLYPRVLSISMDLEENRAGDFTDFKTGSIKGDNLGGWEALFDQGTLDPDIKNSW